MVRDRPAGRLIDYDRRGIDANQARSVRNEPNSSDELAPHSDEVRSINPIHRGRTVRAVTTRSSQLNTLSPTGNRNNPVDLSEGFEADDPVTISSGHEDSTDGSDSFGDINMDDDTAGANFEDAGAQDEDMQDDNNFNEQDEDNSDPEPEDATQRVLAVGVSIGDDDDDDDDDSEGDQKDDQQSRETNSEIPLELPPPTPPSDPSSDNYPGASDGEILTIGGSAGTISPTLIAVGLLFDVTYASREDYVMTREVFELVKAVRMGSSQSQEDEIEVARLPLKLDTLKRMVRNHLPMLQLMRKQIPVVALKQPSLAPRQKGRKRRQQLSWAYWYEPVNLFTAILSATDLPLYFGLGEFREDGTEFWNSRSWTASALACSGEFIRALDRNIVLPGDIVYLTHIQVTLDKIPFGMVRILEVGRSYMHDHNGAIMTKAYPVIAENIFPDKVRKGLNPRPIRGEYLVVIPPEGPIYIRPEDLKAPAVIHIDWRATEDEEDRTADLDRPPHFIMRQFEFATQVTTFLRHTHPVRAELEVAAVGRNVIEDMSVDGDELGPQKVRSVPFSLFIDDFGIFRNTYRALKAFYVTPAGLPYPERRKLANTFTLTLRPHGASDEDVVKLLEPTFEALREGVPVNIHGEDVLLIAFPIVLTGDMPQQADNAGFLSRNAAMGCRSCFCPKTDRHLFDQAHRHRTHYDTIYSREYARGLSNAGAKQYLQSQGLHATPSPIMRLAPALDLIMGLGVDSSRSEWRGLGTIIHTVLFCSILSKQGREAYNCAFQNFPFPSTWRRIQSPAHHIKSWSSSEAGCAMIIIPLILRAHGRTGWYSLRYIQAVVATPEILQGRSPYAAIIEVFARIARHISNVTTNQYFTPEDIDEQTSLSRDAYMVLLKWAEAAGNSINTIATASADIDLGADDPKNAEVSDIVAAMTDILADDAASDEDNDEGGVPATDDPRKKKKTQIDRWRALPNFHIGKHFVDVAAEYGAVSNCNVLPGELRHKLFKTDADHASPPNLMQFLFSRDLVRQSARLGVAGWWAAYDRIRVSLELVHRHCPRLMNAFAPLAEHGLGMPMLLGLHDADADGQSAMVQEDTNHKRVRVSKKGLVISRQNNALRLTPTMKVDNLEDDHPFKIELRQALENDYLLRHRVRISMEPLKYYQRLAMTDGGTNQRWVFNAGDFMNVTMFGENGDVLQTSAKVLQFFTLQLSERPLPLAFAVVSPIYRVERNDAMVNDDVLDLEVTEWHKHMNWLIGLDSIVYRPIYMVPAAQVVGAVWEGQPQDADDREWRFNVRVTWNTNLM